MDFVEKARIRLEHWITHNDHHQEEYAMFVEQLQDAGKTDAADNIRKMMDLTAEATDCLRKALQTLE